MAVWGDLSDAARRVAGVLGLYADQSGRSWPGNERIAKDAGLRRVDSVSRALAELRGRNLIKIQRRPNRSSVIEWINGEQANPDLPTDRESTGNPDLRSSAESGFARSPGSDLPADRESGLHIMNSPLNPPPWGADFLTRVFPSLRHLAEDDIAKFLSGRNGDAARALAHLADVAGKDGVRDPVALATHRLEAGKPPSREAMRLAEATLRPPRAARECACGGVLQQRYAPGSGRRTWHCDACGKSWPAKIILALEKKGACCD